MPTSKYSTPFHKVISRDKGVFNGRNLFISADAITWVPSYAISITDQGQLYSSDENDSHYLVLQNLQSCFVQVIPDINGGTTLNNPIPHNRRNLASKRREISAGSSHSGNGTANANGNGSIKTTITGIGGQHPAENVDDEPPVIFIKTYDNDKLYIKIPSKTNFGNLLASLIVWQNLKPQGLAKKWYSENKVLKMDTQESTYEVLVCRFKVYGPIPTKSKNLKILPGLVAPSYQQPTSKRDPLGGNEHQTNNFVSNYTSSHYHNQDANNSTNSLPSLVNEGWFYTMGVLKSNGMLNFITELDGTLLYSIDIKTVMSSEVREVHHSIFDNSNVLFIGRIKELRWNNCIKTITPNSLNDQDEPFLFRDGKLINSNQRILIEFPLHIDLEDWFVGLNYFAKREYIGSFNPETSHLPPQQMQQSPSMGGADDQTLHSQGTSKLSGGATNTTADTSIEGPIVIPPPTSLMDYTKDNLRVSKKVSIDIIEAKFDSIVNNNSNSNVSSTTGNTANGGGATSSMFKKASSGRIYAEVVMWGLPWSRTAIVSHTHNPFWKEEFSTNLPISTQIVHILIKDCAGLTYSLQDKVIGTVFITPDILTKQLHTSSTMMTGSVGGGINVNGSSAGVIPSSNAATNDIVRLSIYDSSNLPIGKLLLTVNLKEYHVLAPRNFKTLESMLLNAPMKDLIKFCNTNVPTSDFENVSLIMLDIFQSLGIEDKWFKSLMEVELINVDKITRKNYVTNKRNSGVPSAVTTKSSNNVFNTLFRGSSIFSKSLEKYNLRIGQEYLEKVFGDFFAKISREKMNCEVDPRYVILQEKAERKKNASKVSQAKSDGTAGQDSDDDDSDDDSDNSDASSVDSELERERDARVKAMVNENFNNLYNYAEEIWHKIYITSNDLPEQIKTQLKNFRTKVELACDPEDKTTALNCLSAFIFLRFFCPAILNPKLFYLTKDHQTGETQRTLTLIAKILLNLANRQDFSPHKEPHLVKMNDFLSKHQGEVLDYFDKITGRKNDFNEKILDLSHEVKRFDLGLGSDATSSELPTTPYLIDKYLRLTELIHLLDYNGGGNGGTLASIASNRSSMGGMATTRSSLSIQTSSNSAVQNHYRDSSRESNGDIHVNAERNVYQIGSLEFEKSEFLDLAGDNETEGFLKSLCRSNENIFSFITSNITLKDLQKQSTNLMSKVNNMEVFLESCELPINYQTDQKMWEAFTEEILSRAYLDTQRNCLTYWHGSEDVLTPSNLKKLTDNALTSLKLKFPAASKYDNEVGRLSNSFSSTSLASALKGPKKKNPFKKWLSRGER
ncbi:GTPase activating protein Bud2p [[Candida] railenensis]|uniref:GTPase activating protein Bud2p n=1 Tax=[Candida] railenensis TaxID=45579 RepID=A0A9P0QJX8_9ASCO|nr:GTPase activating protein Bud2p [[Candida] railenensis]